MGKFAIVGASNTIIDFAVFYLLHSVFDVYFVIAHISGFLIAVINSFYFNATWTFQSLDKRHWHKQAVSYAIVGVIGLGLSTLTICIGDHFLHVYLAKVLATFVSFSWNYIASKFFVFKAPVDTQ